MRTLSPHFMQIYAFLIYAAVLKFPRSSRPSGYATIRFCFMPLPVDITFQSSTSSYLLFEIALNPIFRKAHLPFFATERLNIPYNSPQNIIMVSQLQTLPSPPQLSQVDGQPNAFSTRPLPPQSGHFLVNFGIAYDDWKPRQHIAISSSILTGCFMEFPSLN